MKILVTGATGFVGHALCSFLSACGHIVVPAIRHVSSLTGAVAVGNIDNTTNWTTALTGCDVVIHLAARVHVMRESATDPLAEFLKVNLHGTSNLARQAACSGVKRLVYVSSIKVNGEQTSATQSFTELDEPSPQDFYSISKWQAEQALRHIAQETGLEIVIVRPPLVCPLRLKKGIEGDFARVASAANCNPPLFLQRGVKRLSDPRYTFDQSY